MPGPPELKSISGSRSRAHLTSSDKSDPRAQLNFQFEVRKYETMFTDLRNAEVYLDTLHVVAMTSALNPLKRGLLYE